MEKTVIDELRDALRPFIKKYPQRKDTVMEEDVELLISSAVAFHVEKELLSEIQAHPDGVFWDFGKMIPEGVPEGQEDILEDGEDE